MLPEAEYPILRRKMQGHTDNGQAEDEIHFTASRIVDVNNISDVNDLIRSGPERPSIRIIDITEQYFRGSGRYHYDTL